MTAYMDDKKIESIDGLPLLADATTLPLTYGQQALWFLQQSAPENVAYNLGIAMRIHSPVDVAALRSALQSLSDRHPAMRTTFPLHNGAPVQVIHNMRTMVLSEISAEGCSEEELRQQVLAAQEAPYDFERGPLARASLFRHGQADHVLLLSMHHIISDGWSLWILLDDLRAFYTAAQHASSDTVLPLVTSPLPPIERTYADYLREQTAMLASAQGEQLWKFWQETLAGELPLLNLPTDRPIPAVQRYRGGREYMRVDPKIFKQIAALGKAEGATLFATLLTAFQVLLHRYTGQEEIIVGTFADGRWDREFNATAGYFTNPVAIRVALRAELSFKALLAEVRQRTLMALSYQDYPFPLLVEQLRVKRTLSHPPVFQAAFSLMGKQLKQITGFYLPDDGASQLTFGDLAVEPYPLPHQEGAFFLTLELSQSKDTVRGFLKYNTDLFDASTIVRMVGHFQQLLASIVANPDQSIADLPLLPPTERQQLLVDWNDTNRPYPYKQCVHRQFEAQVRRTPDAVALVLGGDQSLTYSQLNSRANQLARHLRQLGVRPETLVGICLDRSVEMVVGLLGILKAGGAYVPLDPTFPPERLAFMIEDAQPLVLLTQEYLVDLLPLPDAAGEHSTTETVPPHVLCWDRDWPTIAQESAENPRSGVKSEHLAYVLYTSGSTGKPKGVQIEHRALTNFLHTMSKEPGLSAQDVLLAVTTISFDIAGLELYLPLISGAKIVLADSAVAADGLQLVKLLNECEATVMQATPATWRMLLAAGWQGSPQLKMLCGGEALPQALADQLVKKGASLWNMYGPTETTIWSAISQVQADRPQSEAAVPIGRPIANTQLYILDAQQQPVPIGVPGELYIGGDGLARGYLNRPELTAEKFVHLRLDDTSNQPPAISHQPTLYRTGDLARYLPDGTIEFLGRIDNQVKVHGFRIELGEIEAVLNQHPAVAESVVVVREEQAGDKRLVAYVVMDDRMTGWQNDKMNVANDPAILSSPHPVILSELRDYLKTKLPDYMTPATFVFLDELPLTPNGKVDRNALPAPVIEQRAAPMAAPQTATEATLATLWCELLGINQVGREDDFFAVGGHSLRATQLIYRVQESFAVTLSIQQLFNSPTIAGLAQAIGQAAPTEMPTTGMARTVAGTRSCVVALQTASGTNASSPPFFCVHPLAGVVFPYSPLVAALSKEQAFYGLQSVGVTDEEAPLTTIEAMASRYINDLRMIQPEGPYALGGWSFGAYVAYEMACQLEQTGQQVALLALIDTPPPSANKLTDTINWSKFLLSTALPSIWPYLHDYFQVRTEEGSPASEGQGAAPINQWALALKPTTLLNGQSLATRLGGYQLAEVVRMLQIMRTNVQAVINYMPQPYSGRITLLRTGQTFGETGQTPDLGWRALAADGVEIYRIPGEHMDVLRAPHVQVLAGQLQRQIEAVGSRA